MKEVKNSRRIVIIGGGLSSLQTAKTIREQDTDCQITLITMEEECPYDRTQLLQYIVDEQLQPPLFHPLRWYEEQRITLMLNEEVIRIQENEQYVETFTHQKIPYDELILACGSSFELPEIEGNELPQIFTLSTWKDALAFAKAIKKARRCCIVGGSLLGITCALQCAQAHMEVTLIEEMPRLLSKHLDQQGSDLLVQYLQKQKIHVQLHAEVQAFHGIHRVECVELTNGKCIDCDVILCAKEAKANLNLLKTTTLAYDRYLHVDACMRTSLPHIYACGEMVSVDGIHHTSCMAMKKQGETAGKAVCGIMAPFAFPWETLSFHHEGISIFQIGDIHQYDQYQSWLDDTTQSYCLTTYQEQSCTGVLLFNAPQLIDFAKDAISRRQSFYKKV